MLLFQHALFPVKGFAVHKLTCLFFLEDLSLCLINTYLIFGRWKEVRHDNTVTWLAFWNDPINPKEFKYVFLAASSSLKGQSDKEKYEKARMLKVLVKKISCKIWALGIGVIWDEIE